VLRITREIVDITRSKSKPDRGVLTMRMTVANQDDAVVMSFVNLMQMPVRPR
jgi:acyl dehydratase